MDGFLRETGLEEPCMVLGCICEQMGGNIKENTSWGIKVEEELTPGLMEKLLLVSERMEKDMV